MTNGEKNKAIRELKDKPRKRLLQEHPSQDFLLVVSGAQIRGLRDSYKSQVERETQPPKNSHG